MKGSWDQLSEIPAYPFGGILLAREVTSSGQDLMRLGKQALSLKWAKNAPMHVCVPHTHEGQGCVAATLEMCDHAILLTCHF